MPNITGNPSAESIERQRISLAAGEVMARLEAVFPAQQAARAAGIGAVSQEGGAYSPEGQWEHYLRCGDALDSAGCAP